VVGWNGRIYEAIAAKSAHRPRRDLYHAALTVGLDGITTSIEMGPVWNVPDADRGVVGTGPVGSPLLGRVRMFRYEIRCWPGGRIPDLDYAVDSFQVSADREHAAQVLSLTREVPLATWGRDEQRAGEMWNSNSMVSWLLSRSGHDPASLQPPARGRAPGWDAGLVVAARGSPAGPPGKQSGGSRRGAGAAFAGRRLLSRPRRKDGSDRSTRRERS
jgi:hypothetical protein